MDLVIMAAGLGSRFGGDKQINPVDEDGNFIIDYSIYDAIKAGFDRVILIIRKEHKEIFDKSLGQRIRTKIPVEYAFQSIDDVPAGVTVPSARVKPWGTAHAMYACRDIVSDKFAIINADDFYGYDSFRIVAEFLRQSAPRQYVSVGYRIKNTLSENGAVKRGLFKLKGQKAIGMKESLVEKRGNKIFATPLNENDWREILPEDMVSMSIFGFSRDIMQDSGKALNKFFRQDGKALEKGELLLTNVVNNALASGATMDVLPTKSKWYGITYKEDLANIKNAIIDMKAHGEYPAHLYNENCME